MTTPANMANMLDQNGTTAELQAIIEKWSPGESFINGPEFLADLLGLAEGGTHHATTAGANADPLPTTEDFGPENTERDLRMLVEKSPTKRLHITTSDVADMLAMVDHHRDAHGEMTERLRVAEAEVERLRAGIRDALQDDMSAFLGMRLSALLEGAQP